MILLKKNAVNQFGITASELKTLTNPNYLFEFYNQQNRVSSLIYLTKVNTTSLRYDLFDIDLPNDLDLKTGDYIYNVYESNNMDLDKEDKKLLETGKLEVIKEFPVGYSYVNNNTDIINYG